MPRRPGIGRARWLAILALGLAAALLARFAPGPLGGGTVEGRPRLVDGDSLFIGSAELRMQGIDAPEGRQTCTREGRDWACGEDARRNLQRLIGAQPIRCEVHSTDTHGRGLATCFSAAGDNLNARMVEEGFAVAFGSYQREEAAARSARRGLWASQFDRPQDWRRRNMPAS
ncbi:MAG: thermonuclease family protein [Deltaproteobacteria bacterium]